MGGACSAGKTNVVGRMVAFHNDAGTREWAFEGGYELSSVSTMGQTADEIATPSGQRWNLIEISGGSKIYPLWGHVTKACFTRPRLSHSCD